MQNPHLVPDNGFGEVVRQRAIELQPLTPRLGYEDIDCAGHTVTRDKRFQLQGKFPGFDLCQIEDIVQYPQKGPGRFVGCFYEVLLLHVQGGIQSEFKHAEYPGHRGAQLMAHVGEELAFGPAGRHRSLLGLVQRLLGPFAFSYVVNHAHGSDDPAGCIPEVPTSFMDNPDFARCFSDYPMFYFI